MRKSSDLHNLLNNVRIRSNEKLKFEQIERVQEIFSHGIEGFT